MKARAIVVLFAVAVLGVCQAQTLKIEIQRMNGPIRKAMMKKDVNAFKKIVKGGVTSDFKYSENGRSMSFDEMVEGMKQGFAMYSKVTRADSQILRCSEKGNAGSAVEKHVMEGTMMGPDKKSHKVMFMGTSTETYKKIAGKWKMASMDMKTDKMTMDGKPMTPPPMGK